MYFRSPCAKLFFYPTLSNRCEGLGFPWYYPTRFKCPPPLWSTGTLCECILIDQMLYFLKKKCLYVSIFSLKHSYLNFLELNSPEENRIFGIQGIPGPAA